MRGEIGEGKERKEEWRKEGRERKGREGKGRGGEESTATIEEELIVLLLIFCKNCEVGKV